MSRDDADLNALFGSDDEDGDLVSKPAVGDGTYIDQSGPEEQHRHLAQFRAEEEEPEEEEEEEQDAGPGPEDDAAEEPVESIRVDLPLRPKLPSERLSVVKLSNIVDIEKKPFDRDTFEPADETYLDDQGTRRLRPSGEGVIRWRTEAIDDELKYESNARIVQWSDGSMQLVLGEEILDISVQDITSQNQMLYLRMGGVLQGQAMLRTKLNFQPSSLESKLHRRLAAAVDRRYTKASRVRTITKQMDPELERARREKQEEMSIKEREQRRAKQRRAMDRAYSQARASRPPPRPHFSRGPLMTAGYLEDDGYDEDYLAGGEVADVATDGRFGGGSRFVDEGEEAERERRLTMAKRGGGGRGFEDGGGGKRPRLHDSEDDQQDGVQLSDDDEDEDEDLGAAAAAPPDPPPRPTPAAGRRAVIMDDDDDD